MLVSYSHNTAMIIRPILFHNTNEALHFHGSNGITFVERPPRPSPTPFEGRAMAISQNVRALRPVNAATTQRRRGIHVVWAYPFVRQTVGLSNRSGLAAHCMGGRGPACWQAWRSLEGDGIWIMIGSVSIGMGQPCGTGRQPTRWRVIGRPLAVGSNVAVLSRL